MGFYLVDKGRFRLERAMRARFSFAETVRRACLTHPLMLYLGAIVALTVAPGATIGVEASYRRSAVT